MDRLFRWRRDVRHFRDEPVCPDLLKRLLEQTDTAPSVGLSQPWRWVYMRSPDMREAVRENFQASNADALAGQADDRKQRYASLKLAGLDRAPVHLADFCDEASQQGHVLGVQTMPEMRRYSCVCAIFQLWLSARAYGLGLGWVSILDADRLTQDLRVANDWHLIAYLCLGYPEADHDDPELQRAGWESRRSVPILTQ